ncbi:MAG: peptidylprolyl isomerase, partial [Gemmatimonadota bacterium]
FGLEVGQVSDLLETPDAFFVIQVTDHDPADRDAWKQQIEQQRRQVLAALQSQRVDQFLNALREQADVVDERAEVLRPTDQAGF